EEGGTGRPQAEAQRRAAPARRAGAQAWAGGARVRHESLDRVARRRPDPGDVRGEVSPRPCVAAPQAARLELPAADGPRAGTGRGGDSPLEARALAGAKKNAAAQGQTIVFVDESGLTERPHRCRTWSPRGQTPVLQYHFNWNLLSAIAGITWWSFYFRLFPGAIKGPQVVESLSEIVRGTQPPCPRGASPDASPAHARRRLLAAGGTIRVVTILCDSQ